MKVTSEQLLDLFGLKVGDKIRVYDNSYNLNEILDMELVVHDARLQLKNIDKIYGAQYFELTWLLDFKYEIIKQTPKLTEDENVILRNIKYKYIARDKDGDLFCGNELGKDDSVWYLYGGLLQLLKFKNYGEEWNYLTAFNHLFQFITWEDEEPYNIKELLKGNE